MSGLSGRLSRSFLLVAVAAVSVTATLTLAFGSRLFAGYLRSTQDLRNQRVIWTLERAYAAGGWSGVRQSFGGYLGQMAGTALLVRDSSGRTILSTGRYALAHPESALEPAAPRAPQPGLEPGMGPAPGAGMGQGMRRGQMGMMRPGELRWGDLAPIPPAVDWRKPLKISRSEATYALELEGRRVGTVTFALPRLSGVLGSLEENLRRLIVLTAVLAGLMAAVLAWVSGVWLARRLARPVFAVRDATRRFAAGDLQARAELSAGVPDELAELGQSVNRMADHLERLEQMRRRLTADVAHELRTPMAAARNLVEAFQDGVLAPDKQNLAQLGGELERLGRIVTDLRDLSVAESGTLQLASEHLDLREVLDSVAETWRPRFAAGGIGLTVSLPVEPLTLRGDAAALERVFGNLLSNAFKYTGPGGEVRVAANRESTSAVTRVADTGEGIPAEELPLVFERFFRGETARRAAEGTGVGLAIVREITRAHGGDVTVASHPGEGTEVTVRLPLA